jgi:hypothetical protein
MTDETDGHVPVTRRQWDEHLPGWFERYARPRWAAAEPSRGIWCIPQSRLPILPADVAGPAAAARWPAGVHGPVHPGAPVPADQGPATDRLVRDLFGLQHVVRRSTSGTEYRLFTLPHGQWIGLMARCGPMVEDLIEVQVPAGATSNDFPEFPDEWVRRWPAEEVWFARRRSARTGRQ